MRILSRLLAILAVALVAAQPVMACCLVGHDAVAQDAALVSDPPCHDSGMQMSPADHADAAKDTGDCPGCNDCDSPLMQAQVLHARKAAAAARAAEAVSRWPRLAT